MSPVAPSAPSCQKFFSIFLFTLQVFKVHCRTNMQTRAPYVYGNLYKTYGHDLMDVIGLAKKFCSRDGVRCLSEDIEMEVSYLRLRHVKPDIVWEVSPNDGFSTLFILHALQQNRRGVLFSFDVIDKARNNLPIHLHENWTFVMGDFRSRFHEFPVPDYLYLDSFHSAEFGLFYREILFPSLKKHTFVSLHDVYNPQFWSDLHNERDMKLYPAWMANEEGLVILDWLAFQDNSEACRVFTFANSRAPHEAATLISLRTRALKTRQSLTADDVSNSKRYNPTIYFELNCLP
jgi:hypothetical protein